MKMYRENILSKRRLWRYLRYGRGHGVHSPYAYSMVRDLLQPRYTYYDEILLRAYAGAMRDELKHDRYYLDEELGLLWFRVVARFAPDAVYLDTPAHYQARYYTETAHTDCPIHTEFESTLPARVALLTDNAHTALQLIQMAQKSRSRVMIMIHADEKGSRDEMKQFVAGITSGIVIDAYNTLLYTNKNNDLYIYRSTL